MSPFEVINLKKMYKPNFEALKGISLSMKEGEVFGLLGPNGAGKTTLISILTSVESITSGEAYVFGKRAQENDPVTKAKVGVVPQELINHGFFDIYEVLSFQSGYYGILKNKEYIEYLLRRLDLFQHRKKKIRELSGGMKRRFLIAKALVHRPKLLILDEPTAGVDIELRNSLWEFVRELNKDGMSMLLTTHYLEEAEQLCDRIGIIHHGELKALDKTKEIIKKFTKREVHIRFFQNKKIMSPYLKKATDKEVVFEIPSEMGIGELFSHLKISSENVQDIKIHEGRLEEAFLSVLERESSE